MISFGHFWDNDIYTFASCVFGRFINSIAWTCWSTSTDVLATIRAECRADRLRNYTLMSNWKQKPKLDRGSGFIQVGDIVFQFYTSSYTDKIFNIIAKTSAEWGDVIEMWEAFDVFKTLHIAMLIHVHFLFPILDVHTAAQKVRSFWSASGAKKLKGTTVWHRTFNGELKEFTC